MTRRTPLGALLTIAAMLTAGCLSSLRRDAPEQRAFVIEARRTGPPSAPLPGITLEVQPMRIAARYSQIGFTYRIGELEYEGDFYNEFFIAPDQIIGGEVARWLLDSGLFEHTTIPGALGIASHLLVGRVTTLHGDFSSGDAPKAVLEIQFLLLRPAGAMQEIQMQKNYLEEVTLSESTPEALAAGWSRALERILMELENDLRDTLIIIEGRSRGVRTPQAY